MKSKKNPTNQLRAHKPTNTRKQRKKEDFYLNRDQEEIFQSFLPPNLPLVGTKEAWTKLEEGQDGDRGSGEEWEKEKGPRKETKG